MNFGGKMKITTNLFLAFILLSLSTIALGDNKLECTYSTKTGGTGCFFSYMKLYDQNSDVENGDMYCGPTSAAMALSAIIDGGKSFYSDSWVKRSFANENTEDRIENLAVVMDTDVEEGTLVLGTLKFPAIQSDIVRATSTHQVPIIFDINDARIRKNIRRGDADIMSYGHYTETCTGTGSSKVCKYERNSGHFIALNGYYYTPGSSIYTTHTFDPDGGVEIHRNIGYLSNRTNKKFLGIQLDYRPFFGSTYRLYSSGTYNAIIESVVGINTN